MKNRILGLCLALLPSTLFSQTSPSLPPQEVLHSFLQEHQVPGLAVALIDEGKVMETQYLGTGMPGHSIDESTFFNTASLTKSITAFLTLQLIENGTLSLEEPLHPYWVDPDVVDDPRHQTLTPHILLSHQSGFANWRWMEEDEKLRFQFDPGTQFGYSGEGYEYLRRSLEAKQQSGFRSLVQENVFDPLHMENSHLSWVDEISEEQFAGEHKNLEEAYEITKSAPNAADDLITTLPDLGKFCEEVLRSNHEHPEYYASQVSPRQGISFTYGWVRMNGLPNGEYGLLSAGSDQGVNAIMVLLPNSGRGMIALTNSDGGRSVVMKLIATTLGETGEAILGRF